MKINTKTRISNPNSMSHGAVCKNKQHQTKNSWGLNRCMIIVFGMFAIFG